MRNLTLVNKSKLPNSPFEKGGWGGISGLDYDYINKIYFASRARGGNPPYSPFDKGGNIASIGIP